MLKVAVELPSAPVDRGELLADVQALEAAGADSVWAAPGPHDPFVILAALAAVTHRIGLGCVEAAGAPAAAVATLGWLSRDRLLLDVPEGETWARIPEPSSRAHWNELLEQAASAGATGVRVPMSPRLVDLLRNPDVEDDRSDLQLAQG